MRRVTPDLRQLRTFVAVAERGSFTRAADDLYVAQQAVSQQVKALETALGVTLLWRTSRRVELTPAGKVFLADCRRVLAAADRAVRRVQEAARGEVGTLRIAYTLTAAWQTVPALLSRLGERYPQLKVQAREVFAADIPRLLHADLSDVGIGPATDYPADLRQQLIRLEPWRLAVGDKHPLADRPRLALRDINAEQVELWPREMTPGRHERVPGRGVRAEARRARRRFDRLGIHRPGPRDRTGSRLCRRATAVRGQAHRHCATRAATAGRHRRMAAGRHACDRGTAAGDRHRASHRTRLGLSRAFHLGPADEHSRMKDSVR